MSRLIHRRQRRRSAAFTLIEVLVVVTIIGLLATLIITRYVGRVGQARDSVARQKISVLTQQVLLFEQDVGRLPLEEEGLESLVNPPDDVAEQWKGPYVKAKDIIDPWDNTMIYRSPGQQNPDFDIFSMGEDGRESEDDIGNW
jgi:general secretion pathway protein G